MAKSNYTQTQTQQQALTQTLSPQQLLAVQLLELTTIEIEDRVRSEVMDNPVLEVATDSAMPEEAEPPMEDIATADEDDYSGEGDIPVAVAPAYRYQDIPVGDTVSFGDTLMEQLGQLPLSPREKAIGEYIIGSLDEDGLLRKTLSEIEDELLIYNNIDTGEEQIYDVLRKIQSFEPAGIAARDLRECLLLQLHRAGSGSDSLSVLIISDYYDDFVAKRWEQLAARLAVPVEEFQSAISEIVRLNPRPGASLSESIGFSRQQIVPDFLLDVQEETVQVSLNNAHLPSLKVSDEYVQLLEQQQAESGEQGAAALFLKQKIDTAKGFISAVSQREQTMLATMRAIVAKQKSYFLNGGDDALLKPMILEDISRATGYDISTISRVSSSKYLQAPWGVVPLKHFFSDGVVKDDGSEQSVYELFGVIKELVDNEDKSAPLTDQALQELLVERGYNLARRTVAKYREQLNIPVARMRKCTFPS